MLYYKPGKVYDFIWLVWTFVSAQCENKAVIQEKCPFDVVFMSNAPGVHIEQQLPRTLVYIYQQKA